MIKTHIAGAAAMLAIGLAGLGGAIVAVAAPANAAPDASGTTSSADSSSSGKEPAASSDSPTNSDAGVPSRNERGLINVPISVTPRSTSPAAPTSSVGSKPTSTVSSTGGALTSSAYSSAEANAGANRVAMDTNLQADMSMVANFLDKTNQLYGTIARIGS
jgi:hypothetical protein